MSGLSVGGALPATFDAPTLGRAVCLGELYDQRSGKFLGVQLYPQHNVKEVVTDIKHSALSVGLSTTHQQKATVLDIKAQLSLDVLGGLVKVSGSASYLKDEKSNTNEYAYAMALKMRFNEKRILFAEDDLGRNVLKVTEEDYINPKLATHFVSAIVYGGNYIVNLVARQTETSKEEKIEGKLQASLDKLMGVISLEGSIDAEIKGKFKDMDDKFDLVVHGDVALDKVPITPKDVLDTFPAAASLITKGGGVPISATLQPIPPGLYKGSFVYEIENNIVDLVLTAFSNLDDIRSRFVVLLDSAKRLQDFVPELTRTARGVAAKYFRRQTDLLYKLSKFLQEYKSGGKPDHAELLREVTDLYNEHLKVDTKDSTISSQYPSSLAGLENQLSRFQYFVTDIRAARRSLVKDNQPADIKPEEKPAVNPIDISFYLSSIEDVSGSIRTQKETLLFVMVPISGDEDYGLKVLQYLAIVRKYSKYFQESINTAHMLYVESLADLEGRFPNQGNFSGLEGPAAFAARVDDKGNLSWEVNPPVQPPSSPAQIFQLHHKPTPGKLGNLSFNIDGVDGAKAYTFHIWAKEGHALETNPVSPSPYFILLLTHAADGSKFLSFRKGFGVQLEPNGAFIESTRHKKPGSGNEFTATFVQDTQRQQWILYLDGNEIASKPFPGEGVVNRATELCVSYPPLQQWWDGELYEVKAFARALTQEQVQALVANYKRQN